MIYTTTLANPGDDCITLSTEKLNVIKFKNSSINVVRNKTEYKLEYSLTVENLNTQDERVCFTATSEHLDFKHFIVMDMQRFTDEVYLAIQEKKLPDSTEYIKELKIKASSSFGKMILKEEGEMTLDTEYDAFGYVYSGTDKIGTFEKLKFIDSETLELIDVFSILELDKTEDLGIEYSLLNKKYIVNDPVYLNNHKVMVAAIDIADNDIEVVKPREDFNTYEDFIEDRKRLLNISTNNDNLSIDEFDDLF